MEILPTSGISVSKSSSIFTFSWNSFSESNGLPSKTLIPTFTSITGVLAEVISWTRGFLESSGRSSTFSTALLISSTTFWLFLTFGSIVITIPDLFSIEPERNSLIPSTALILSSMGLVISFSTSAAEAPG